jgi:transcriptional regulator with XRE-family HTH domain
LSKKELLSRLIDPEYRQEFIASEIDIGLPMQLRAMRDARGWKQSFMAEKTGTKQPRFSLMERPGYGNFSLNTLKKLASLFDVGLIVSFVPWGEMIDFVESMSNRRLSILPFSDERKRLSLTYARQRDTTSSGDHQLPLVFSTGASTQVPSAVSQTATRYQKPISTEESVQISPELLASSYLAFVNKAGGGKYDTA